MNKISYLTRYKCGIYCIINLVNGKKYVGSSVNIYNRLHEHLHNLRHNRAHNAHLLAAWNKYGEDAFEFNVIDYCSKEDLFKLELYYIDCLRPEYNFSLQVLANQNRVVSEECRQKISNTLKRRYKNGEIVCYKQLHNWVSCSLYDINSLEKIQSFNNIADACRFLKYYHGTISKFFGSIIYDKYCIVIDSEFKKSNLSIVDFISKYYLKCRSKKGMYLVSEDQNNKLTYYRSIVDCAKKLNFSSKAIPKRTKCTKENPYVHPTDNYIIYYIDEFIPQSSAVLVKEFPKLLQTNIGEDCDVDPEINKETKKSLSS